MFIFIKVTNGKIKSHGSIVECVTKLQVVSNKLEWSYLNQNM